MIEQTIIDYLVTKGIAGGKVYAETPVKPPATYVIVSQAVIAAMLEIRDNTTLMRCNLETEYDAAMTSSKEYRYQALWGVTE